MIFFSYSRDDKEFALKLVTDLRNRGVSLWVDLFNMRGGDDWPWSIQQAVDSCNGLITVVSRNSLNSKYCRRELLRADDRDIQIFPVLLTFDLDLSIDWPIVLQERQYIDFSNWQNATDYDEKLDNLFETILDNLPSVVGTTPKAEIQYLNNLLAELEAQRGVLEYIEIESEMKSDIRPKLPIEDEWGFSLLVQGKDDDKVIGSPIILPNITEAINRYKRFVLIGKPGSGKTTTLRRLARDNCRRRLEKPENSPLPLLLYLPKWTTDCSIQDLVLSHWNLPGNPLSLLRNGEIILYLDGLNEMGSAGSQKASDLKEWLLSAEAPIYVVVTCREEDYREPLRLHSIPAIITRELNKEQISAFAQNYLGESAEKFLLQIQGDSTEADDRSLNRLSRNPYMLSALILLYQSGGELPTNGGALFAKLARALWQRERQRNTQGWIPFDEIEASLGRLAFSVIDEDLSLDFPLDYAMRFVGDDCSVLEAAQRANFLEIRGSQVRFFHQLVLEYFAAAHMLKVGFSSKLSEVQIDIYTQERIGTKWDNVYIALAGFAPNTEECVLGIANADPVLAAMCIESGANVSESSAELIYALVNESGIIISEFADVQYGFPELLENIAFQIGQNHISVDEIPLFTDLYYYIEDPNAISIAIRALTQWPDTLRETAAAVLEMIGDETAIPGLLEALNDSSWFVAKSAASALLRIGGYAEQLRATEFFQRPSNFRVAS